MLCELCGVKEANQRHHKVFRSKVKALEHCDRNLANICYECHYKIHHNKGRDLDLKLKLSFQNELEMLFDKEYLTYEDIKEVLQISDRCMKGLLKTIQYTKDGYKREDVIMVCMGGRLYE